MKDERLDLDAMILRVREAQDESLREPTRRDAVRARLFGAADAARDDARIDDAVIRVKRIQDDLLRNAARRRVVRSRLRDFLEARATRRAFVPIAIAAAAAIALYMRHDERTSPRYALDHDPDVVADAPRETPTVAPIVADDDVRPAPSAKRDQPSRERRTEPATDTTPDASTTIATPVVDAPAPVETTPVVDAGARDDWRTLASRADYAGAMAAARAIGLDTLMSEASAQDLLTLASVTQRAGEPGAVAIYERVRQRFSRTDEASTATFMLGRLASSAGNAREAVTWLDRYLAERPYGSHARDALGRLIESHTALGDAGAAQRASTLYLERYPRGPHAPLARRTLDAR